MATYEKHVELGSDILDNYLASFGRLDKKDSIREKAHKAFLLMRDIEKSFLKKEKGWLKLRNTKNYQDALEAHFSEVEKEKGFYDFDSENFLPLVAGLAAKKGSKLLKGGIDLVKKKLTSKKTKEQESPMAQSASTSLRTDIARLGADEWLNKRKKAQIDHLIKVQQNNELTSKIRQEIARVGLSRNDFKHYEDEQGNYSYEAGEKIKDVIGKLFDEYKAGETAKEKNKVLPWIFIAIFIAFFIGTKLK